jgi:hypothetical protein
LRVNGYYEQGATTVTGKTIPIRSIRPSVVKEISAVIDGVGDYDESLQARLHMVGTSLQGTDLDILDALGAYAVANTSRLGVLAGPTRRRLEAVCRLGSGMSVSTVSDRYGFVDDRESLLDVAAHFAAVDAPEAVTRSRLQYLFGAAKAELDVAIDGDHFTNGVASRLHRDAPERWELPARVRAAEYKTDPDLEFGDAPRDVQRILAVDPGIGTDRQDPPREPFGKGNVDTAGTPDRTEGTDTASVDFWGCPFCYVTGDLGTVVDHVSDPEGPHGHRTARHVPGYDATGAMRATLPAEELPHGQPVRADCASSDRWTTPGQREAARLGVPLRTVHTETGCDAVLSESALEAAMDPDTATETVDLGEVTTSTSSPGTGSGRDTTATPGATSNANSTSTAEASSGGGSEPFDWLSEN